MPIPLPEASMQPGECHIAAFADDAIVREVGSRLAAADLYAAYHAWCRARGREPLTQSGFGRRMREMGYRKRKGGPGTAYLDIELAMDGEADADQITQT